MFITLDILQKRGACQEYLDFFAKHYPDGVEMKHMIERGHLPYHAIHWGYQWLDPDEEEIAAYWKRVCVEDSEGVFESDHIYHSSVISQSSNVTNGTYIYSSKNITNSSAVVDSEYIDNSNDIWDSFVVEKSDRVLKSKNVSESNEVCQSNYVVGSSGIYQSDNIVNSVAIWKSEGLTDCAFCFNCRNSTGLLFCTDADGAEYQLFNKPIDKVRFNMIQQQLKRMFSPELTLFSTPETYNAVPKPYYDYRKHFSKVTDKTWEWVKTLPGYNPSVLYSLTFNPMFLG